MLANLWKAASRLLSPNVLADSRITAICDIEWVAQPDAMERKFHQRLLLLTTASQGTAFYDDIQIETASDLMNCTSRDVRSMSVPVQLAFLDSLFVQYRDTLASARALTLNGIMAEKAIPRSRFICDEVMHCLQNTVLKNLNPVVALIGVSALQAKLLTADGVKVEAWDRNPEYIGTEILPGISVGHSSDVDAAVRYADVVLVSGMTAANNSLSDIVSAAHRWNTKVVVWAVSGSNISPLYIDFGVDAVVSETFPFYFLPGCTHLNSYRRLRG